MITRAVFFALALGFLPASAHEFYTDLTDRNGHKCCGGDDCEAVVDYRVGPDGAVLMRSERHHAWVLVPAGRVEWKQVPGGEDRPAHWCGRKRQGYDGPVTAEQPDPDWWTYCAFVVPPGT